MKILRASLICLVSLFFSYVNPYQVPSSRSKISLPNSEQLDDDGKVFLGWEVDPSTETITFEIEAETTGFVGLGISPQGSMVGADIFIAGVGPDGVSYSSDRFGIGFVEPEFDDHSDWNLLEASEANGTTYIKVSRLLDTCDDEDYPITADTNRIIWAMGTTDEVEKHVLKGSKSLNLLGAPVPDVNLDEFLSFKMSANVTMPKAKTTYWCSFHKGPLLNRKHHIVAFDAYLVNADAIKHTHHFVLTNCYLPTNSKTTLDQVFGHRTVDNGVNAAHCNGPDPEDVPSEYCQEFLYLWAKGGKTMVFPKDLGYPISDGRNAGVQQYYMMQVHLDNPEELDGVSFATGVTFYYTDELRPIEAGLLTVGHTTDSTLTVPPNTKDYVVVGHCSLDCTPQLPEDGVTIFNTLLHAHLTGRKLKFRHFRGNLELPWIDFDNHYDFNYQQNKQLVQEVKVLPGDQLTYECTYDSNWKNGRVVSGGLSTEDEMCEVFAWYYPKMNLDYCGSMYPRDKHYAELGITEYRQIDNDEGLPITMIDAPESLKGVYDDSMSTKFNWTTEFKEEYARKHRYELHEGFCKSRLLGDATFFPNTTYPVDLIQYVPEDKCHDTTGATGNPTGNTSPTGPDNTTPTENTSPTTNPNAGSFLGSITFYQLLVIDFILVLSIIC